MSPLTEQEIVRRLQNDRSEVMEIIYDRYAGALFGISKNILQEDELAKEAMQNGFVKIWQRRAKYDADKGRLFTWMLNIVRHCAIDIQRREQRHSDKKSHLAESGVYETVDRGLNISVLDIRSKVAELDEKYRTVLDHLFFQGMTQQEASEALEIPLGTVKTRLRIAMRELRVIYGAHRPIIISLFTLLLS